MLRQGALALALSASLLAPASAQSPDAAAFYTGKTVDFVIGSAAGGGYAVYAALLARHIGKHIPGKPQVVPRLMDGAGSLTAANYVYSRAARDGTAFGAIFTGAVVEPLIGDSSKARYDSREFGWIGSANRETAVCFTRPDVDIRTWRDLYQKTLIVGGAGWTSSIRQYPAVLNKVLGMKFEVIQGYPGSKEALQAVERGEVQGTCGIQWSSFAPAFGSWITEGKVRLFGQISAPPGDPLMNKQNVPNIWEAIDDDNKRQVLRLIFDQSEFGRPYMMPPGVPKDRLAAMRAAFDATMKDEEFLAEAARMQLPINPMTGDDVQREVQRLYKIPETYMIDARRALE